MRQKLNHISLSMNEVSSFEKELDLFWLVKKLDLSEYQIDFVVYSKNWFFGDKKFRSVFII